MDFLANFWGGGHGTAGGSTTSSTSSTTTSSNPPPLPPAAVLVTPISRLGIPSRHPQPTALAVDQAQSLVAVGFHDGTILVVGSPPNFEVLLTLKPPSPSLSTSSAPSAPLAGGATAGPGTGSLYANPSTKLAGSAIKLLRFKTGEKYLIGVNNRDELIIWKTATAQPLHPPYMIGAAVSFIDAPYASGWCLLGLESGKVIVFDIARGKLSDYAIPCPDAILSGTTEFHTAIVSLALCPTDANLLLIGYRCGPVIVWDMRARAIFRKYLFEPPAGTVVGTKEKTKKGFFLGKGKEKASTLASSNESLPASQEPLVLSCACWKYDGSQIVAGVDKYLVFWSVADENVLLKAFKSNESKRVPLVVRTLDGILGDVPETENTSAEYQRIDQVAWKPTTHKSSEKDISSALYILGGNRFGDLKGITVMEFAGSNKDHKSPPTRQNLLAHDADIAEFSILLPPLESAMPSGSNAHAANSPYLHDAIVISMTTGKTVKGHALTVSGSFAPLSLSPSLTFLSAPEMLAFAMNAVSTQFLTDFRKVCTPEELENSFAMTSNVSSNTPMMQPQPPPAPLTGGCASASVMAAALAAASTGSGVNTSHSRIAPPDLLITAHADSCLRFWHADPGPFSSPSPPVLLVSLPLTHLITLNRSTGLGLPVMTYLGFDPTQRTLVLASGPVVLVLRYISTSEALRSQPGSLRKPVVSVRKSSAFSRQPTETTPPTTTRSSPLRSQPTVAPKHGPRTASAAAAAVVASINIGSPSTPSSPRKSLPAAASAGTDTVEVPPSFNAATDAAEDEGVTDDAEVEEIMKQLDSTIDEVLADFKETRKMQEEEEKPLIDLSETPAAAYDADSESKPLPPVVPEKDLGDKGTGISSISDLDPLVGPPSPPQKLAPVATATQVLETPSLVASPAVGTPATSGAPPTPSSVETTPALTTDTQSDVVTNATVVVDRMKRTLAKCGLVAGWATVAQAVHSEVVAVSSFCSWLNILATGTMDGKLTIVDIFSGQTVQIEEFEPLYDGSPNEVVLIHFLETFFEKEPIVRPTMIVGTADGAFYMYLISITPPNPNIPRVSLRRVTLIRPPKLTPHEINSGSVIYNRPLKVALFNEYGAIVTQQIVPGQRTPDDRENYLLLCGSRHVSVMLLASGLPAKLMVERNLAADAGGRRGPGSTVIAAGVAVVNGGPTLLTVARDSSILSYLMPSLEPASGIGAGAAGGAETGAGGWGLGPRKVKVLEDGRVCCWSADKEIRVMAGLSDPSKFRSVEPKIFDTSKQNAWIKAHGRQGASLAHALNDPGLDELFKVEGVREKAASQQTPKGEEGGDNHAMQEFADVKDKLNERGEALQNLERKFDDLGNSSANFLETIKEYNRQQENKKWWQL